ncbi:protein artichoke-like [Tachypleus tridentatus]|uniref:protein artichoke-like n=1 Tax=Tachypleus tridentatus TaxID=6853 RepID=UPI003FD34E34
MGCKTQKIQKFASVIILMASWSFSCPPPENIAPCTCQRMFLKFQLNCKNIFSSSILEEVFEQTVGYRIDSFQLEDSSFPYFSQRLFQLLKPSSIILTGNAILSLAEPGHLPFEGLEDSLEYISVSRGQYMNDWNWSRFTELRSLTSILLSSGDLSHIGPTMFRGNLPSLLYLTIKSNHVHSIDKLAFSSLESLQGLALWDNSITSIERSMFPNTSLSQMNLSYNKLSSLPNNIFDDMPKLEYLDLRGNQLKKLMERMLGGVWNQLETLYLSENPLQCDCTLKWISDRYHRRERPRELEMGTCVEPPQLKGQNPTTASWNLIGCFI